MRLDEKEREQFLSDQGTFSPDERECFHRLCKTWQPEMSYERASEGTAGGQSVVDRLMDKLRKRGYGLVRTTGEGQSRRRAYVVLTDQYDIRFSTLRLDEELSELMQPGERQFPTEALLKENGIQTPEGFIQKGSYDILARLYTEPAFPAGPILRLPGSPDCTHLVTVASVRLFVNGAIERVRNGSLADEPLEFISRLRDSSLTDTRHVLMSRDPVAWEKLTSLIIEKRTLFDGKKNIALDDSFFRACFVTREFVHYQIIQARERKKSDEERRMDFAAIAQSIREHLPPTVSAEELGNYVLRAKSKYGDKFDEFSREFYDAALSPAPNQSRSLPIICRIGDIYIHRDHLLPEFRKHLGAAAIDLAEEYIGRMEHQLKNGSRTMEQAFISRDNFELDIAARISAIDAFLHQLLQEPVYLAELVIHGLKQEKGAASIQDIRSALSTYMDVESGNFHPLSHLLDLNMVSIFEQAFLRLSVIRQLIIRIAGRYDTYKDKYVGRTLQRPVQIRSSRKEGDAPLTDLGKPAGAARKNATSVSDHARPAARSPAGVRKAGTGQRRPRNDSDPRPARPRGYNQRERDEAWEEFSKTLRK